MTARSPVGPPQPVVFTGRTGHCCVIILDPADRPDGALCQCGAFWNELHDAPVTVWALTHTAPPSTIAAAIYRTLKAGTE